MALAQLLPSRVRNYRTTIITNTNVRSGEEVERKIDAGDVTEVDRPLGVAYPAGPIRFRTLPCHFRTD